MLIELKEPKTELELETYYQLRWELLRKPWNQPRGSEKDSDEDDAIKVMAIVANQVIGVGRIHHKHDYIWQIRYMAVDPSYQGKQIGAKILENLENIAKSKGAEKIILEARKNAVKFYKKNGYQIYRNGKILFEEIKHFWMHKILEG